MKKFTKGERIVSRESFGEGPAGFDVVRSAGTADWIPNVFSVPPGVPCEESVEVIGHVTSDGAYLSVKDAKGQVYTVLARHFKSATPQVGTLP